MITLITDTASLNNFIASLESDTYVTVDTEFMREKTYYPLLCLVQVAGKNTSAAIDPLATGIDLSALYRLLADSKVLKVFHACRQDMEIFYNHMRSVPAPVFDTQIAAMVCGYGESVSYETIVNKTLGIAVDKSSRFTDWSRRPLSDKQLAYAVDDVLHLREVYANLEKRLAETGRMHWIEDEMRVLHEAETYEVNPDDVWKKLRLRNASPRYLALLQAVARWRELVARERNVPRSRILKDEILTEIAASKPKDYQSLQGIRGFYPTLQAAAYDSLFRAISEAESLPSSEYPRIPAKPVIPPGSESLIDLLRLLLKNCAGMHQVVPRLIADKDELELLAIGKRQHIPSLQGWRHEIFGQKALRLLEGRIAIRADGSNGIEFMDLE